MTQFCRRRSATLLPQSLPIFKIQQLPVPNRATDLALRCDFIPTCHFLPNLITPLYFGETKKHSVSDSYILDRGRLVPVYHLFQRLHMMRIQYILRSLRYQKVHAECTRINTSAYNQYYSTYKRSKYESALNYEIDI